MKKNLPISTETVNLNISICQGSCVYSGKSTVSFADYHSKFTTRLPKAFMIKKNAVNSKLWSCRGNASSKYHLRVNIQPSKSNFSSGCPFKVELLALRQSSFLEVHSVNKILPEPLISIVVYGFLCGVQ